jgi:hypothetical protein
MTVISRGEAAQAMSVRVHIWQVGNAWLASCPSLEAGGRGDTRGEALRVLKSAIARDLEMLFAEEIQIVNSPPPMMKDDGIL